MTSDGEFTRRLIGFGLSEKEAQLYLYLLKYGPKNPSPLAKSLHTYREDVHRMLTSLIEKGTVRPSLDSPTVYIAVDLERALKSPSRNMKASSARWRRESRNFKNWQINSFFGRLKSWARSRFLKVSGKLSPLPFP